MKMPFLEVPLIVGALLHLLTVLGVVGVVVLAGLGLAVVHNGTDELDLLGLFKLTDGVERLLALGEVLTH